MNLGDGLHTVEAGEDSITVDGKEIKIYAKANAEELPWGEIGVDVVLECTGFYTSKAKAQAHINAGAKKVVISAPAGNDLPTIVYNVNHETLTKDDTSFPQLPVQQTAWLRWQKHLTIWLRSNPVSCAQSMLTQAIR